MGMLWRPVSKPGPIRLVRQKLPRHVAIAIDLQGIVGDPLGLDRLKQIIDVQVRLGIRTLTLNISSWYPHGDQDRIIVALQGLNDWTFLDAHSIKVSVLGRWYNLPDRVVDKFKQLISRTKEYGSFTVNIGINYDGQEEIVDAISRICRQVRTQKVDPERITKELVKANLDTAVIDPPDLIITTGKTFSLRSFMLWDAAHAKIFFSNVSWDQFSKSHVFKALVFFQNTGGERKQ